MAPLDIAPAAQAGKSIWGGTVPQAFGRFLVAIFFILAAVSKVRDFDKDTGGPMMSWFGPKLDNFFLGIKESTGLTIPIQKAMYPQILLTFASVEFLAAVLFASDIRLGAWLLSLMTIVQCMLLHNFWDYQHKPVVMQNELTHFVKNIAILGGLVFYLASDTGTKHKNKFERTMDAIRAENDKKRPAGPPAVGPGSSTAPPAESPAGDKKTS